MKPIYEPKGAAKEYGDLAINIYTGCPHRCNYCYVPQVLHKNSTVFHTEVSPRKDIVEAVRKQLEREKITDKTIHLCFTCDPYPTGYDTTPTREIIKLIKESGNHVQILTKADEIRDFDLLDSGDWFGVTIDGAQNLWTASDLSKVRNLYYAHGLGIKTWVSFEPVIDQGKVLKWLREVAPFVDKVKIGKLNYIHSSIKWGEFGRKVERICKRLGVDYYIKESLRKEMNKGE